MTAKVNIVPLNEAANIYIVVDERGRPIGTGTKEVCEFLAQLSMGPAAQPFGGSARNENNSSNDTIRSAIKI